MLRSIVSSNAGEAAFSRFSTTNTWPAAQTFSVAATFSAAFASTGGATFTSSATATPSASFRSQGTISAIPTGSNNIAAQFITAQAATGFIQLESSGAQMYLQFRRRNGTYAVPTAIANGDRLGSISWVGQWGTTVGNLSVEDANFFSAAAENFTSTARGTSFQFETTTIGTTTLASRLTLSSGSATFSVPVITSSNFQISAAAGTTRDFFWRTSGSTRFTASINAVAESGSNAGSNFELRRYSDAGADLGLVMDVTRSSGNIAFNTGGGISTFANDIVAPYVQVSRPAGSAKPILYRTGSTTRWTMQATSGAESGGNVGADWALDAHVDAGGYNFTALAISRSSGNAVFYNLVTAPQLRVSTSNAPASATATGASGMIRWDANYIYVCTATDTWKRVAIATWP